MRDGVLVLPLSLSEETGRLPVEHLDALEDLAVVAGVVVVAPEAVGIEELRDVVVLPCLQVSTASAKINVHCNMKQRTITLRVRATKHWRYTACSDNRQDMRNIVTNLSNSGTIL